MYVDIRDQLRAKTAFLGGLGFVTAEKVVVLLHRMMRARVSAGIIQECCSICKFRFFLIYNCHKNIFFNEILISFVTLSAIFVTSKSCDVVCYNKRDFNVISKPCDVVICVKCDLCNFKVA